MRGTIFLALTDKEWCVSMGWEEAKEIMRDLPTKLFVNSPGFTWYLNKLFVFFFLLTESSLRDMTQDT